ncbi:MAG: hypothetical protein NVSMB55_27450 [Mycobacteriales bacterium]
MVVAACYAGALAAVGGGVPLYDGVGFPDQPYRYVQPPPGMGRGPAPHPASASDAAAGSNTDELDLQSDELGPQLALALPPGSVLVPPGASAVTIRAIPLAPDSQPADGTIDGNVYRIVATAGAQPASFGPNVGQSFLYLRAASTRPTVPLMEYRSATNASWRALQTGRGGTDVFVASFKGAGDYALVQLRNAPAARGDSSSIPLFGALMAGFVVLLGLVAAVTRRRAAREQPPRQPR